MTLPCRAIGRMHGYFNIKKKKKNTRMRGYLLEKTFSNASNLNSNYVKP